MQIKCIAVAKATLDSRSHTETLTSQAFPFCLLPSALCPLPFAIQELINFGKVNALLPTYPG